MGIIDEGKIMDEYKGMPAMGSGVFEAGQAVEQLEIFCYGRVKRLATEL